MDMKLLIISGLSGSGKSIALHALEDIGYYCVDNLPLSLLPGLFQQLQNGTIRKVKLVAVGIDSRNLAELDRFPEMVDHLNQADIDFQTLYLQADDKVILKRFSETRRRHPLSSKDMPLAEAIQKEREILQPVFASADLKIDTSHTNVHELRQLVQNRIEKSTPHEISLLFESFGYKNGIPADADFVFDVRCLPNPHWEAKLRSLTGKDAKVITFLQKKTDVQEMLTDICQFLEKWLPRFKQENRSYMTIAVGCTGGQHRSVYLVGELVRYFMAQGHTGAIERHRELL